MICNECHSTIHPNYKGACVTCLRRELEQTRVRLDVARAKTDQADRDRTDALSRVERLTLAAKDHEEALTQALADRDVLAAEVRRCRKKVVSTEGGFIVMGSLEDSLNLHDARAATDASGALTRAGGGS